MRIELHKSYFVLIWGYLRINKKLTTLKKLYFTIIIM